MNRKFDEKIANTEREYKKMKEKLKFGVSLSSSDSDIDDGSTNEENSVRESNSEENGKNSDEWLWLTHVFHTNHIK